MRLSLDRPLGGILARELRRRRSLPLTMASRRFARAGLADRRAVVAPPARRDRHRRRPTGICATRLAPRSDQAPRRKRRSGRARTSVPGLRAGWTSALLEPSCADIDVAGAARRLSAQFQRQGGVLMRSTRAQVGARRGGAMGNRSWRTEQLTRAISRECGRRLGRRGRAPLRRAAAGHRAAIGERWFSCASAAAGSRTCRWSIDADWAISISRAKRTIASGSARTTRLRAPVRRRARRDRRRARRSISFESRRRLAGRGGRAQDGRASGASLPTRLPVYGFDATMPGLLLVRGAGRVRNPDGAGRGKARSGASARRTAGRERRAHRSGDLFAARDSA